MFHPRVLSKPSSLAWRTASLLSLIAMSGCALNPSRALAGGRAISVTHPAKLVSQPAASATQPAASATQPAASATQPAASATQPPASAAQQTAIASQIRAATGYSASVLENKPVCANPGPGRMSCRADVLALRSNGKPVALRSRPGATPENFSRGRTHALTQTQARFSTDAARASELPAIAAPQPYSPAYLQWAYDLTWLSATAGSGDTIAVVDAYDDPDAEADLAQFRWEYGLYPCTPAATATAAACEQAMATAGPPNTAEPGGTPILNQYNVEGQLIDASGSGTPPPTDMATKYPGSWEVEESLDLDAVSSICPNCTIDLVEAVSDQNADLQAAADEAAALEPSQISMSWGEDVNEGCDTGKWWFSGVSTLAAAGDYGYQGSSGTVQTCDPKAQYDGNSVSYPAAHSMVTAVGGTTLTRGDTPRGFVESVWGGQPELSGGYYEATQSGCDTSQPIPSYQDPPYGLAGCAGRAYNDISADADPASGISVYDSFGGADGCDTTPTEPGSCPLGGTSLATPMTAAYEALIGIAPLENTDNGPAWAYDDAAYLNDITVGTDDTNNTCLLPQIVICNAAAGWDGPTGNGSISGDLVSGAPGIGGAYATSVTQVAGSAGAPATATVSLQGGLYPNGLPTTYQWDYGTTTSYEDGSVAGSGTLQDSTLATVEGTLANLVPCTVYHFRLDGSNIQGSTAETTYGYDETLLSVSPTVTGTGHVGDALTAQLGLPTGTPCNVTYQWEEADSPAGAFTAIAGATSPTYVPTASDLDKYIQLVLTGTDSAGVATATATSTVVGPVAEVVTSKDGSSTTTTPISTSTTPTTTPTGAAGNAGTVGTAGTAGATTTTTGAGVTQTKSSTSVSLTPKPPTVVKAPTITSTPEVGGTITVSGGSYSNASGEQIQFLRCAHTCTPLNTGGAARYKLTAADAGHYIEVKLSVHGAAGTVPLSSTNWVGPVTDASTGALTITAGARIAAAMPIRSSTGVALATVVVSQRTAKGLKLAVSRTTGAHTSAWVCVGTRATWDSCTVARAVRGTLHVRVAIKPGQTVKVVAAS